MRIRHPSPARRSRSARSCWASGRARRSSCCAFAGPTATSNARLNVQGDRSLAVVERITASRGAARSSSPGTASGSSAWATSSAAAGSATSSRRGVYGRPDRDEAVGIADDQLRAVDGAYRLSVTEPMDEVAYLDRLVLEVVDRPPGVSATPRRAVRPRGGAADRPDRRLARRDRAGAGDRPGRRGRHRGAAGLGPQGGGRFPEARRLGRLRRGARDRARLRRPAWAGSGRPTRSSSAWRVGWSIRTRRRTTRRRRPASRCDPRRSSACGMTARGRSSRPHAGYPAGLPRMTTLDLTGKLTGPRCTIRLRTNMECYWDRAFLAHEEEDAGLEVTALPVARGVARRSRVHPRSLARRPATAPLRL